VGYIAAMTDIQLTRSGACIGMERDYPKRRERSTLREVGRERWRGVRRVESSRKIYSPLFPFLFLSKP
jgi:hypothetical protein